MQVTAVREEPADPPNDEVIESLAARAARLAYFSPEDLQKSLQGKIFDLKNIQLLK